MESIRIVHITMQKLVAFPQKHSIMDKTLNKATQIERITFNRC